MSKTIDQRVVEMRFDNRHFETNVAHTMSTVEKLKQKLNFSGTTKGIENIDSAVKKVDMSGLGSAVETVRSRFSALEIMGVTALANITNSAVNAGKRMAHALTIQPITTGFREYETQMNAVQTILANTQSKGSDIEDVNQALDKLNTYADKTIYNFTEMTRNIGTFTAAGVDLQTSVDSIKGIANLAAVSGSSSSQASTAMYQLSQALAAGRVSLMDWNSVVNAGMGGELFQQALIRTSEMLKTGAQDAIDSYGSFRESLTKGEWLTTEVLTETLKQLSGAYTEADLIAQGFTESQAKEITNLAQTASDAATKVKTFTQLWDVLKESAQSGWAQTWKLIVGDFEEARDFLSPLADTLTSIVNKFSDVRNNMLKGALTSKWDQLTEKVEEAGLSTDKFLTKIEKCAKESEVPVEDLVKEYGSLTKAIKAGKIPANVFTKALKELIGSEETAVEVTKDLGDIVKKVINGEFGTGEERVRRLTEAGYDFAEVQNKVNETLGSSVRHISTLTDAQKEQADSLAKLNDAQLKAKGFTDEQITALRELAKAAKDGNTSINELINSMDKPSGRTLLLETFNHLLELISDTLGIVKEAWDETFHPDGEDTKAPGEMLYNFIEALHDFVTSIEISEEKAAQFRTVMEGIFAGLSIGNYMLSTSLTSGLKILDAVLKLLGTDMLGVASQIANLIIKFKDWLTENTLLYDGINKTAAIIAKVIEGIGDLAAAFLELQFVQTLIENVKQALIDFFNLFKLDFTGASITDVTNMIGQAFQNAIDYINNLDAETTGFDFVKGLALGIASGIKEVISAIVNVAKTAISTLSSALGVQSPSVIAFAIGAFFIAGFILGMQDSFEGVWATIRDFGAQCMDTLRGILGEGQELFANISWGKIFAGGVIIAALALFKKMVDVVEMAVSPVKALNDMLNSFGGMASAIGSTIRGIGAAIENRIKVDNLQKKSKAILNFAIAIGVLAASIWVLSKIEGPDLLKALGAITALTLVLFALVAVTEKLNKSGTIAIKSASILAMATSLLIIAGAFKLLSTIVGEDFSVGQLLKIFGMMYIAVMSLMALARGFAMLTTGRTEVAILKMGGILMKMSLALLIMAGVIKIAGSISTPEIINAANVMLTVGLLFAGMVAVSSVAGEWVSRAGTMMIKMSIALGLMLGVIKLAAMLDRSEINKAIDTIAAVSLLFAGIIAVSQLGGQYSHRAGSLLLRMSLGILAIVGAIKLIATVNQEDINKALATIALLELTFAGLIAVSYFAGEHAAKAGIMLLMMSGALLILSGVIFILSELAKDNLDGLKAAVGAIAILEILFMGLIAVTKLAKDCKTTLIVLTVAVGVLALFLTALSFIDPDDIQNAADCMAKLMGVFAGMMIASKIASGAKIGPLITMIIAVTAMAALIWGLTELVDDMDSAVKAASSLAALMLAFAGFLKIVGRVSDVPNVGKIYKMLGVVVVLALVVAALSLIPDTSSLITATASLSALLLALAGAMFILGQIDDAKIVSWNTIGKMAAVVAGMAIIVSLLAQVPNPNALIPAASSLAILLISLAASMSILAMVGPKAAMAVTPAAQMTLVVGALAIVLGLLLSYADNVESVLPTAKALSILLLALSAACWILAPLGATGPAALTGVAVLAGVIAGLGLIAVAIGELMQEVPTEKIETWKDGINKLMDLLSALAYGLGKVVGNLVGGFVSGSLSFLPELGEYLSGFMDGAGPFIEGAKKADKKMLTGVGIIAAAIAALTASSVVNGMKAFAPFAPSFEELGGQLSGFMDGAGDFIDGAKKIDADAVAGIESLAAFISAFSKLTVPDMVFSGAFFDQLPSFGESLQKYASSIQGLDSEAISTSATAAEALVKVARAIPNMGGFVSIFTGDNDFATFGSQLVFFGAALKEYGVAVTDLAVEPIAASVTAAESLAKMATAIPNFGGLVSMFTGENDMYTFGMHLVTFGASLKSYGESVTDLPIEAITASVTAAEALANMSEAIPNLGGLISLFTGDNSLGGFATQLAIFGAGLKEYGLSVTDLNVAAIDASVLAGYALSGLAKTLPESGLFASDDFGNFGSAIKKLGGALNDYGKKVSGLNVTQVNSSIAAGKRLVTFIESTSGIDTSGVATFKEAVSQLAKTDFDGLAKSLNSSVDQFIHIGTEIINALNTGIKSKQGVLVTTAGNVVKAIIKPFEAKQSEFQKLGTTLMTRFNTGLSNQKSKVVSTVSSTVSACVTKARAYYSSFYSAGSYVVTGFANGISANAFKATARAAAMAQAALNAARSELDINSPSRESRKLGVGFGEGFVYGLVDMFRAVRSTSSDMASNAINSFGGAIAKANDMISMGIDAQPTIRPVVDLSDVSAGAATIGEMLSLAPSVGVMSNVSTINSRMNRRNQNGTNSDIVAAIDKLRGDIGNVGGTSYTIGNVTYDDGSALAQAVETIVRYAKIERRV